MLIVRTLMTSLKLHNPNPKPCASVSLYLVRPSHHKSVSNHNWYVGERNQACHVLYKSISIAPLPSISRILFKIPSFQAT